MFFVVLYLRNGMRHEATDGMDSALLAEEYEESEDRQSRLRKLK